MQLPVFIRGVSRIIDLALGSRVPRTSFLMAAAVCSCGALALAQTGGSNGNKVTPGTISGKVTMSGKPAAGIKVILVAENPALRGQESDNLAARTQTDQSGHYSFTGLSPAQYWVFPVAPAAVFQGDAIRPEEGKSVLLDNGETASAVDLSLVPGGVITGRVVDGANQPVSGEEIALERVDASGRVLHYGRITPFYILTDDRGIYRAFRLPAGGYRVSVGGNESLGDEAIQIEKTYSPGVTDASSATIVEVQPGAESLHVDISVGTASKTYSVSGRFVESETGLAVPNVRYAYGRKTHDGATGEDSGRVTDSKGQFRLEGLSSGHYQVMVSQSDPSGFVAEPTMWFDVTDSDLTGVEVKVRRGGTLSGTIIPDDDADPAVTARTSRLTLVALVSSSQTGLPLFKTVIPGPDGSFQLTGLSEGRIGFQLENSPVNQQGYRIARVELNGADSPYIPVGPGQQVTGVNIVVAYGVGSIHGSLSLTGPAIPAGALFFVGARRVNGPPSLEQLKAMLDSVGYFQIDSVPDGDYELFFEGLGRGQLKFKSTPPTVSIVGGQTVNVTIEAEYNSESNEQH